MSSYDDDALRKEFLDMSARETELLQQSTFGGVSPISFDDACQNAWTIAQDAGVPSGTAFKVILNGGRGVNPFTEFRVMIVVNQSGG